MHVRVDATGRDDFPFPGDHLGSRSNNNVHTGLDIGIAGFANRADSSILDRDISLYNSPVIENQCVGDDRIDSALGTRALGLPHAIANDFSASAFTSSP